MELSAVYSNKVSLHIQALAPEHQEAREREAIIDAIANNDALKRKFGLDIQRFIKTESGYFLETRLYNMEVIVKYIPEEGICGPCKFELVFGEVRDRE